MWFNSLLGRDSDDEAAMGTQLRIRLRFRGGAKDGMVIRGNASEVAQRHGRRYCGLALHGQVGTQWCEVPEREYWHIHEVLKPYGSVQHLSRDDLQDIVRELAGVQTHIYEIVQVERTEGDVFMRLRFLRKGQGV